MLLSGFLMDNIIQTIAIYALPVIFAITLHEAAHGYVAKHFGDLTAYAQGRVSLNPIKHIDPIGTILLPLGDAIVRRNPVRVGQAGTGQFFRAAATETGHVMGGTRGAGCQLVHGTAVGLRDQTGCRHAG